MPRQFRGTINLDVQDSVEDREAFFGDRAPQGAPNVLEIIQVVFDGTDADTEAQLAALMARD